MVCWDLGLPEKLANWPHCNIRQCRKYERHARLRIELGGNELVMLDYVGVKQSKPDSSSGSGAGDWLWEFASARGLDRRRFLRLLITGGAAAVLAGCLGIEQRFEGPPLARTQGEPDPAPGSPWFKDPGPFIRHDEKSLEARLENMEDLITPNRLFFVRNNSVSIDLDVTDWRLSIEGDAVAEPMHLTYSDVKGLPSRTLISYLECAGNHRAMFDLVNGRKAAGTQWMTGAISNGEWTGAALSDVLTLAGIQADAANVLLVGLDSDSPEKGFRYVLPVEKAMRPDTLLAYGLNGETLPKDHGFPLRALVPGWVGSANIKWLGHIVVSSEKLWTRNNTTSYVLIGDRYAPEGEARGIPVTAQVIKSALALPWPAQLTAGNHLVHGFAHSPAGPISRVEWSADSGTTWTDAELPGEQPDRSWARFELVWKAEPGEWTIMTRATDVAGNSQPDKVPFNEKGYLFNQPAPHPIRVT